MEKSEIYFIISGLLVALILGYLIAQHNRTQGYSFNQTFMYSVIGIMGLVFIFWAWYWEVN